MITWIATCNNKQLLAESLLSRFRVFDIKRPDAAGAFQLASAVIDKTFEELEISNFEASKKAIAVAQAYLTAREIRRVIEQEVGHAIANGRKRVTVDDLPKEHVELEVLSDDTSENKLGKTWVERP